MVFVPSWTDGVVNLVPGSELNDGESGQLEFLCLPGGTFGRDVRNNGGGGVVTKSEAGPRLVVLRGGERVVRRLNMLYAVGSVLLLWSATGGSWLVFSPPKRIAPREFLFGLSLLHFVVKDVQSIERDGGVLGEACALGLTDKSVGYNERHVAMSGTHFFERFCRESRVLECARDHVHRDCSEYEMKGKYRRCTSKY